MPHVFEFFSNKSDSTLRNKNGAKLYTSLPPFSHLLFYSPPPLLHFSYIFLDIPRKILWRVFHEFLLNSFRFRRRYTLNTSKSNWKYSIRAPCFYIFAFRNRFLSSSPFRCVWNSSCVCVRPPPEDLQKRPPSSSPPQYLFFPRGSFQSFWIEEYVHLYYLYREKPSFRLPLCVRDTAPIVRQFATSTTLFPSLFLCNDLLFPPSLPFNYNPLRNLSKHSKLEYHFNRRNFSL